jgi:hypothetical protein
MPSTSRADPRGSARGHARAAGEWRATALLGRERRQRDDGRIGWVLELRAVPPGGYRVLARSGGAESEVALLDLTASEWTRRALELGAAPVPAQVRGELRSASGTFDEPMELQLVGNGELWSERPTPASAPTTDHSAGLVSLEEGASAPGQSRDMAHEPGLRQDERGAARTPPGSL